MMTISAKKYNKFNSIIKSFAGCETRSLSSVCLVYNLEVSSALSGSSSEV